MNSTSAPAPVPEPVEPREPITRFLRSSSHFAATKNRVKAEGLLPPPLSATRPRLETSVYRTDEIDSAEVWRICAAHVDSATCTIKARATTAASEFTQRSLVFDADGKPHPRHANVIQWPATKNEQLALAQAIANEMELDVRP